VAARLEEKDEGARESLVGDGHFGVRGRTEG